MSLGNKFIKSSALLLCLKLLQRSLGFLSTIILARLLTPADFGIVATAMIVIYFADTLAETGTSQYLIQVQDIHDSIVDTAWTLDILMKLAAASIVLISPIILQHYWSNQSSLIAIMVLAPTIAIRALQSPQLYVEARELNYKNIFIVQTTQKIVSFIVVVVCAIIWESFWVIIVGHYVGTLTTVAMSWIKAPRTTKLRLVNFKSQWVFSKWILSRGFFGYLRAQIDAILISRLFNISQFGTYSIAREIAVMPAIDIISPLTQPLLSSLSRVRENKDAFVSQLNKAILVVSLLTLPICAFLITKSDLIVAVLLGNKWIDAGPIIAAMSPLVFAFALGGITNNLLLSLGKAKTLFWYDVISLIIVSTSLISFYQMGLVSLAFIRSIIGLLIICSTFLWIANSRGLKNLEFFKLVSIPAIISGICAFTLVEHGETSVSTLLITLIQFGLTYFLLVLITMKIIRKYDSSWRYLDKLLDTLILKLKSYVSRWWYIKS